MNSRELTELQKEIKLAITKAQKYVNTKQSFSPNSVVNSVQVQFTQMANRFSANFAIADYRVLNDIIEYTRPYVPYNTGNLDRSAMIDDGYVVYDTDYAQYVYQDKGLNFKTDVHKKAGAEWLDRSAQSNMSRWVSTYKQKAGGGK